MLSDKKRSPLTNSEVTKASLDARKAKKIKVSVIFNQSTHRKIKAYAGFEGRTISDLIEEKMSEFLKEKGKL
jgi:hypothetical protein